MVPMLLAKVWHYWISVALLAPIVLLLIGMGVLYVTKVVSLKYPRE